MSAHFLALAMVVAASQLAMIRSNDNGMISVAFGKPSGSLWYQSGTKFVRLSEC